jgi:hypothetical protein
MKLRFAREDLQVIKEAHHALILGLILETGQVRFQAADKARFPGHREWVASMKKVKPAGGFSLLVKGGRVTGFFPLSSLNSTADARLPEKWINAILKKLPADPALKLYD